MTTNNPIISNAFKRVGRNDPCPCGSGRKFKKCCLGKSELLPREVSLSPESADTLPGAERWNGDIGEYDPFVEPDAEEWLALDEQSRIDLVMAYHRRAGINVPKAKLHAVFHVIVESQIAEGDELPVKRTAQRLMSEGLDRHDAIHAIGSVLAAHVYDLMRETRSDTQSGGSNSDPNVPYFAELERLTAEEWLRSA